MSLFNLDRFRFQKDKNTENDLTKPQQCRLDDKSSSDKENVQVNRTKSDDRRGGRGKTPRHALEDISSDDEPIKKFKHSGKTTNQSDQQTNLEMDKVTKLQEMFPQRSRSELLEIVQQSSTLDGAVAYCLVTFGSKDTGSSKTRGKALHSEEEEEEDDDDEEEEEEDDDEDDDYYDNYKAQPTKRRRFKEFESEEEGQEPSREKQRAVLNKLKKKLPEIEETLLRDVLREHDWDLKNSLESLLLFSSDSDCKLKDFKKSTQARSNKKNKDAKQMSSSLSRWLSVSKSPAKTHNSSNGSTSRAHKTCAPKKTNRVKPKSEPYSDLDDDEGEELDSEVDSVSDDCVSESEDDLNVGVKTKILNFLQEASLDELTLISGCSINKAQKIILLRPFNTWKDVNKHFHKYNGLSADLVHGCKDVLKKRQVLKQLMTRCIGIAKKMTKDVTEVIENGMDSMTQPTILNKNLKLQSYQLIGLKWLILLHQHNLSGILADEMGLGKTIQAIAFLAYLYQNGFAGPHLITVPSSTLDNWVRELKLWCPSLKVLVYYGSVEDRKYLRHDILNDQVEFNVIVSTYTLTIGNEHDRSLFRKLKLHYALFDEGHMLKNMNSLRYRHLMAVNAEQRLLLTGTPLQNNLLELISLLNFIMPSMFSSSTSKISQMFSTKSSEEESSFHKERIAQAKLIMKPFILRRVKSEVLKELPSKVENIEMCAMSDAQRELYDKLFDRLKRPANGAKRELSNVMMQLRKMANHPLLHRQYYTTEKLVTMSKAMLKEPTHFDANPALIQEDMEVMSDFELHNLCKEFSSLSSFQLDKELILDSGKFSLLTKLLAKLKKKGDRVVLFSQFTMMLDIVEILLKHLDHQYIRLDGSTPLAERIGLIDKYNTDPEIFVFLLSTRAGGQGINLASANVVILHDIDCNPFNDKQAEDRCHRMGQNRTVQVIKLVSKDSVEACMLRVGQEKLKLEQDMTTNKGEEGTMSEQMAELLKVSLGL